MTIRPPATLAALLTLATLAGCGEAGERAAEAKTPPAAAHAASTSTADSACLPYEPETVAVTGVLERRTVPGPPNFGESPDDEALTYYFVVPDHPLCTQQGGDLDDDAKQDVRVVQLLLSDGGYDRYRGYLGTPVRVAGTLSPWISGYHHTPVLLRVHSIQPAQPPR